MERSQQQNLGNTEKERMELCELEKNNPACENFTVKTKKETHKFLKSCVFNNTSSNEKKCIEEKKGNSCSFLLVLPRKAKWPP